MEGVKLIRFLMEITHRWALFCFFFVLSFIWHGFHLGTRGTGLYLSNREIWPHFWLELRKYEATFPYFISDIYGKALQRVEFSFQQVEEDWLLDKNNVLNISPS